MPLFCRPARSRAAPIGPVQQESNSADLQVALLCIAQIKLQECCTYVKPWQNCARFPVLCCEAPNELQLLNGNSALFTVLHCTARDAWRTVTVAEVFAGRQTYTSVDCRTPLCTALGLHVLGVSKDSVKSRPSLRLRDPSSVLRSQHATGAIP